MTQVNLNPDVSRQLTDRVMVKKPEFLTMGDEARMRAFTVARVTEARVLQDTLDAVRSTVAKGGTLRQFKNDFPELAKQYTEAGREWHLDLIFQQNARQAFAGEFGGGQGAWADEGGAVGEGVAAVVAEGDVAGELAEVELAAHDGAGAVADEVALVLGDAGFDLEE